MNNRYNEVLKDLDVTIIDYDIDEDSDAIEPFNIGSVLPILIIYRDEIEVLRIIGEKTKKELLKLLEGYPKKS
jgi:hypothetical protein